MALDAGYQSHEAFTRAFVDLFAVSPSRYRGEAAQHSTDIARVVTPPKNVEVRTEPTRKVVCMRHVGRHIRGRPARRPYEALADSYVALIGAWLPSSGHVLAAEPVVESYLNTPQNTAPADLRTEIWVRIEERGWMV